MNRNPPLRARIRRWAIVSAAAHASLAAVSYGLAPFAPQEAKVPERLAFLASLAARIPGAEGLGLLDFVAGRSLLLHDAARVVAYLLPIAVATMACFAVLRLVRQEGSVIERRDLDTLQRATLVFAALSILHYPIFTSDFWLSIAWGRMVVEGVNPYYNNFTASSIEGLPLRDIPQHATYGPLWISVSAAIAGITGRSVVAAALVQKAILAGAWFGTVAVVRRIAERRSPRDAAVAIGVVGWLPASVELPVGEGHNDVLLAFGVASFLWLTIVHRTIGAWLALAGSVLVKYATAPLGVVALLTARLSTRRERGKLAIAWLCSAALAVACTAPYWRGLDFFAATREMRSWRFLTPVTAVQYALNQVGVSTPGRVLDVLLLGSLVVVAIVAARRYLIARDDVSLSAAALSVMAVVVLGLVGHVWPWFMLWLLPLAALSGGHALGRWVLAVFVFLPVLNLAWMLRPDWSLLEPLGLLVFGSATVVTMISTWARTVRERGSTRW
ncbi:MAG TPA: hypothetical protein VIK50_14565 [Gemmatimonadaceae bacterium]